MAALQKMDRWSIGYIVVVDIKPGMFERRLGAAMHDEGHAQPVKQRDALILGARRMHDDAIHPAARRQPAENRQLLIEIIVDGDADENVGFFLFQTGRHAAHEF
ncbi:hypothetical protein D3C78_1215210 [compost metagenome]